jgi:hypothetical protein
VAAFGQHGDGGADDVAGEAAAAEVGAGHDAADFPDVGVVAEGEAGGAVADAGEGVAGGEEGGEPGAFVALEGEEGVGGVVGGGGDVDAGLAGEARGRPCRRRKQARSVVGRRAARVARSASEESLKTMPVGSPRASSRRVVMAALSLETRATARAVGYISRS